jgi:hypothetical protein
MIMFFAGSWKSLFIFWRPPGVGWLTVVAHCVEQVSASVGDLEATDETVRQQSIRSRTGNNEKKSLGSIFLLNPNPKCLLKHTTLILFILVHFTVGIKVLFTFY